tara:strand:+ start:1247 stop:1513 length:267 start_codon:yes stop_codon:yes gene_type:complete
MNVTIELNDLEYQVEVSYRIDNDSIGVYEYCGATYTDVQQDYIVLEDLSIDNNPPIQILLEKILLDEEGIMHQFIVNEIEVYESDIPI